MPLIFSSLLACTGPQFPGLEAEPLDAVTTVIEVSWAQEDSLDEVWVEYGPDFSKRAPVWKTEDGRHRALIVGHPQLTDVTLRAAGSYGGTLWYSDAQTASTGPLPSAVPHLALLVADDRRPVEGFIQVGLISEHGAAVLWLDHDAEPVWYWVSEEELAIPDVALSQDELGVLILETQLWQDQPGGALRWVGLDGELIELVPLDDVHHGVEQTAPGQYTYIAHDARDRGGAYDVVGDQLVRYTRETGAHETLWSAWDHFEPNSDQTDPSQVLDWTHANCLVWDAAHQRYLLSLYNLDTIVEIDPEGGQLRSMGEHGELPFGRGAYHQQHCASPAGPDSFYLFDNFYPGEGSRVDRVEVGEDDVSTTPFFGRGPNLYARVLGDVDLLDDGRLLTSWGSQGELMVLSAEGEVDWQASSFLGTITSNVSWIDDPYQALR